MNPDVKNSGSVLKTADGAVGTSGRELRVFAEHEIYGGTSTGSVLRNGTADSDTIYISLTSSDSSGVTSTFGDQGFLFPDGCYFDEGTSVTSCLIQYREETS